jgi:hypothetical protein
MYKKNDYIIIIAIVFSIELFIVFADEVPASDGFEENFLLSGGQYTNLIQTTEDDPNWVLVTSDTILREDLCEPANWYEKVIIVIGNCHFVMKLAGLFLLV